jgi:hypothetical protein|tara:strand:- start:1091 stop:1483 length:393 start_codon:yes stop_codon:yes gene_type:complete
MSSSVVLFTLIGSLSLAVLLPELRLKRDYHFASSQAAIMLKKQRIIFFILGTFAVMTFFLAINTISTPIFIAHIVIDCVFGLYALVAFNSRKQLYISNFDFVAIGNDSENYANDYINVHEKVENDLREAV